MGIQRPVPICTGGEDMIYLKANGQYLDLPDDYSIPLEYENNLFSTDVINGPFTYPSKITYSDHNLAVLGHPDRINNTKRFRGKISNCEVYFDKQIIFKAELTVKKCIKPKYIEISIEFVF